MDRLAAFKALTGAKSVDEAGANYNAHVIMGEAVATSDSENGIVKVAMDGDVSSADDSQIIELETTVDVREGDTVMVTTVGADGTGKAAYVSGVIGGGDRTAEDIANAGTDAHFWHDTQGAHVTSTEEGEEIVGGNVLIDTDSVDIRDGDKVLSSFKADSSTWYDAHDYGTMPYVTTSNVVADISSGGGYAFLDDEDNPAKTSTVGSVDMQTNNAGEDTGIYIEGDANVDLSDFNGDTKIVASVEYQNMRYFCVCDVSGATFPTVVSPVRMYLTVQHLGVSTPTGYLSYFENFNIHEGTGTETLIGTVTKVYRVPVESGIYAGSVTTSKVTASTVEGGTVYARYLASDYLAESICKQIYPIGSIYMSMNDTNPRLLFGGTWEQIQGRFLLGASSDYSAGSTGGESSHTITQDEAPRINMPYSSSSGSLSANGTLTSSAIYVHGGSSTYVNMQRKNNQKAMSLMPPYLAVYMWKRVS